jgi:flavin reductase (DIM6/NTAB) family NADH-FMN oxidoreductase RutF
VSDIALGALAPRARYKLITGSVMPRPIALVTTLNADGSVNAAPYSAFNYMCEDPPLCALGIERYGDESHREGEIKDTLRNILERGEFVVNMVDGPMLERMVLCATDFPAHVSEPQQVGFELAPSQAVKPPRIAIAPVAWECKRFSVLDYSTLRAIVFGQMVSMHFRDGLLDETTLRVNLDQYEPYGRLGGPNYCATTVRKRVLTPSFDPTKGPQRVT